MRCDFDHLSICEVVELDFALPRCAIARRLGTCMSPSTEKGSTLDAHMAGRPNPFGHRRFTAKGWSIYGAQRAQPVATGRKCNSRENGANRPIRNRWQPTDGKEGVNGSSPLEGFRKFLLSRSFRHRLG
jgi:hypothetical protein